MAIQMSKKGQVGAVALSAVKPAASWFKKGDAVAGEITKEEAKVEQKMAQRGKMWRFFMEKGEGPSPITFVDGNLTEKGLLDCSMLYREHHLCLNGKWGNFIVCVAESEPCPACEGGDEPSLVGVFTVIDHREYISKKGDKYTDTAKLFVAKRGTFKLLQQYATKRGGLAGCRFDVSRLGDQAPVVGDGFDFTDKQDIDVLRKKYVRKFIDPNTKQEVIKSIFVPANYEDEIIYRTAAEIRALGIGKTPIGGETGPVSGAIKATQDVDEAMG